MTHLHRFIKLRQTALNHQTVNTGGLSLTRTFCTTRTPPRRPLYNKASYSLSTALPAISQVIPIDTRPHTSIRRYHSTLIAMGSQSENTTGQPKPVLFFDIDNCLYSRNTKVFDLMRDLIDEYFAKHLGVSEEEAIRLHREYYTNYGLAIEGLVRHHQIDPLEYNAKVDDALPLEGIINPDPELRTLLLDLDRSVVRPWLFTNAYVTHGKRVVRLLGIEDLFEGLTYCDYAELPIVCKPHEKMFAKAMREAGVVVDEGGKPKGGGCYFVDDSYGNCVGAQKVGWTAAHYLEEGLPEPEKPASQHQIRHLRELRDIFPQFFKSTNGKGSS